MIVLRHSGSARAGWKRWLATACLVHSSLAVFINFDNCLPQSTIDSEPKRLQFTPYFVDVVFNTSRSSHNLNITVYGNVSGQSVEGRYPPPTDPSWLDPNSSFGKIVDVSPNGGNYTTLLQSYDFLSYTAFNAPAKQFCDATINASCPIIPSFNGSRYDPYSLSAFSVAHDFGHPYSFASIAAMLTAEAGSEGAPVIACVSANITPALGKYIVGLLTYLPAAILICVAIATAAAAIFSPWGSSNPFKWTTNYGRDEDLLRLVTPGFADCLQYIQFIFLTGALSLNYPGFYQPATSQASWSSLLFDESFVSSDGDGYQALTDGIYATNGTYGMTRMRQLIGMQHDQDLWACMAIWLLVLGAIAVLCCQVAFVLKWIYLKVSNESEEDLRQKNLPLSVGMLVRIIMNYFLLPVVTLSFYQFDIASRSLAVVIVFAALLLITIIGTAGRILFVIFKTKPRAQLFDDLQTVLMYGSLYNTYSDQRAPFALIPAVLAFMRGVAIGAVQPSGIAQLVILAICEVVFLLMLHAFRPFHSKTSMNVVHTILTAFRLIIILLMVAFVPSLGVAASSRGWIGYLILILHGFVLLIFFANALGTTLEVVARYCGAGADADHGAQRGGLMAYGWRQLRNRQPDQHRRPDSMTSDAAILALDMDAKSAKMLGGAHDGRPRSRSASSQMMLTGKRISGSEPLSQRQSQNDYPETPGGSRSPHRSANGHDGRISDSHSGRPSLGQSPDDVSDPYFRGPRGRRNTLDPYTPAVRSRLSGGLDSWAGNASPTSPSGLEKSGEESPADATQVGRDRSGSNTDYAVREVDMFYGRRGPALSNHPTRKRKTGPADPMGKVSTAASLFNRFVGGMGKGKSKEEGKGFEVVRSARPPPPMKDMLAPGVGAAAGEEQEMQTSPSMRRSPTQYEEVPTEDTLAVDNDRHGSNVGMSRKLTAGLVPLGGHWDDDNDSDASTDDEQPTVAGANRAASPPMLLPIDTTKLDVSFLQRQSSQRPHAEARAEGAASQSSNGPAIPRKSSRRQSSVDHTGASPIVAPPPPSGSNMYLGRRSSIPVPMGLEPNGERPTSLGLVSQRTTRDSIVHGGAPPDAHGSAAEIVDRT